MDTNPIDGEPEFGVTARLDVNNVDISAKLLYFLGVNLTNVDLAVGAGIFINITSPTSDRLTMQDFKRITPKSSLFQTTAEAAAILKAGIDLEMLVPGFLPEEVKEVFEDVRPWIPTLHGKIDAHVRKEVSTSRRRLLGLGKTGRRLLSEAWSHEDPSLSGSLRLVRSLAGTEDIPTDTDCEVDVSENQFACVRVDELELDMAKIIDFVKPILKKLVKVDEGDPDGYFDKVGEPLLELDEPLPGISDIANKKLSALDVAEIYVGEEKSGADTVRKIIKIYKAIKDLAEQFDDSERLRLADSCIFRSGTTFSVQDHCSGGLIGSRRRLSFEEEMGFHIFPMLDAAGLPMSPNERYLTADCPTTKSDFDFEAGCSRTCDCSGRGTTDKAKCKALVLRCRATTTEGLSFPILEDPTSAIGLLAGQDVILVDFSPPPVTFAFEYDLSFVIYTPPTVELGIFFEFSVTVQFGVVLDTKGIREAVQEGKPEKALSSFALKDTFDGADLPLIKMEATVGFDVAVSAAIVRVGVSGSISFIVTIDFYDPFPETSGGLIRPYEMLVLGTNPLDWFELELQINIALSFYVQVGLYLGFVKITVFEIRKEINFAIFDPPLLVQPQPFEQIVTLDVRSGVLELITDGETVCKSMEGEVGNEVIQCWKDTETNPIIRTYEGVKRIGDAPTSVISSPGARRALSGASVSDRTFECIKSPVNAGDVGTLALSYAECSGYSVGDVVIHNGHVLFGPGEVAYSSLTTNGLIRYPSIDAAGIITTVGGDCNDFWDLEGHTNLVINAYEIQQGCQISASGGTTNAKLVIDLGYESLTSCEDGNEVRVFKKDSVDGGMNVEILRWDWTDVVTILAGPLFTDIAVKGSLCSDTISILSTQDDTRSIEVYGGEGADTVVIGSEIYGVDEIEPTLSLYGGSSSGDTLRVNDTASSQNKDITLRSTFIQDMLDNTNSTINYRGFETIDIRLSGGQNRFTVVSTAVDSSTYIQAQHQNDTIVVQETQGYLQIHGGGGDDEISIYGLGEGTEAVVYGDGGDDLLFVDGRGDPNNTNATDPVNTLDGSRLRWNGGSGNDTLTHHFTSAGTSDLDIFDDDMDSNLVFVECSGFDSRILSRRTFLANLGGEGEGAYLERLNIDIDTASITSLLISLNGGENSVYFDDTVATMVSLFLTKRGILHLRSCVLLTEPIVEPIVTALFLAISSFSIMTLLQQVDGGPNTDEFRFGQMFNSERSNETSGVSTEDFIETTLTTKGYLSDACSHPVTVNGGGGNDFFDVLRNKCFLDLNGMSGDDGFVVRSFIAAVADDGSLMDPGVGRVKVAGGDDADTVEISSDSSQNLTEFFSLREEIDPDYLVNSLVDVDGGTGTDSLLVVGTEADDSYVVQDGKIFGGGLTIKYRNIETLDVTGEEGNDLISVLSTSPDIALSIYGSKGSDRFEITPRNVAPVTSKNLRGHRGIIEHTISAPGDPEYDGLRIRGVAVDILDNDGDYGYVSVVDQEKIHLMSEDGNGTFSFDIFPTRRPQDDVYVNVVAPFAPNEETYLFVNGEKTEILFFAAGNMTPQTVTVSYNSLSEKLDLTEIDLALKINVDVDGGKTKDPRFITTEQTLLPVDIRLIPSINNDAGAMSVTVHETEGSTAVAEGNDDHGFTDSYDIYLRPCGSDAALKNDVMIVIEESVTSQVKISPPTLYGSDFDVTTDCKATVMVSAHDDGLEEGDHFVTLRHVVKNITSDEQIILSDGTPLIAANVLVHIYDDDIAGVVVRETNGVTATAEIRRGDLPFVAPDLYQDQYSLRLTKEPVGYVQISAESIITASDREGYFTPEGRNTTKRNQLFLNAEDRIVETLTFTSTNWSSYQNVTVMAFDDNVTEGVDFLNFASQPAYLALLQGPITISGGTSPEIPDIGIPLILPTESNPDVFIPPPNVTIDNSSTYAIEENQVDSLIIYNWDVRGDNPSNGTLIADQFTGMGMSQNIFVGGIRQKDGISFAGMEVVEFHLGNGIDNIVVEETSSAIHIMDLGGGDDNVQVKQISGPFIIQGGPGDDNVVVSSNSSKLDEIRALLAFDGGSDDDGDALTLDNTADTEVDDILNLTRLLIEVDSMSPLPATDTSDLPESYNSAVEIAPVLPRESYLINLRNASGGSLTLVVQDPTDNSSLVDGIQANRTLTIEYPFNASVLEGWLQELLIPGSSNAETSKQCGELGTTKCSNAVRVWQLGDTDIFAIFFLGERLNSDVSIIKMDTYGLINFDGELFQNRSNDLLFKNSDVAYSTVDTLNIKMGHQNIVCNVRGTSAETFITTQEGDDSIFISSDASVSVEEARSIPIIYGWLDYLHRNLHVEAGLGRHRLLMSDESSDVPKGHGIYGFAQLNSSSLKNLTDDLGNIYFNAEDGNWADGVNLWLSPGDDYLEVSSIPTTLPYRTTTSVHAGNGSDILIIDLDSVENDGGLFVGNGQGDNDILNASTSSLDVILFGDGGDDILVGGSGEDILIGDFGRVMWVNESTSSVVAVAGGGGYGDRTDGIRRSVHSIRSYYYTNYSSREAIADGGSDILSGGSSRDVLIGGDLNDTIKGGMGSDLIFGDFGTLEFEVEAPNLAGARQMSTIDCNQGGSDRLYGEYGDDVVIGGALGDNISGGSGDDVLAGDCISVLFGQTDFNVTEIHSSDTSIGGEDTIYMGPGDDIAIGGAFTDHIYGETGRDIIVSLLLGFITACFYLNIYFLSYIC